MKRILLLIILIIAISEGNAQTGTKIEIARLVKIVETSNFSELVKLVHNLSYLVVDSSKEKDGTLFYITRELKLNGAVLGCTVRLDKNINHLSFSTYDKAIYDDLKKQIISLGFKPGSKGTGGFQEVIESQDFEKDKLLINASALKKNDAVNYEFTFVKW